jgi:hypothetical protein
MDRLIKHLQSGLKYQSYIHIKLSYREGQAFNRYAVTPPLVFSDDADQSERGSMTVWGIYTLFVVELHEH